LNMFTDLSMIKTLSTLFFTVAVGGVGFWALSTTLHEMTVRDCNLGVELACKDLKA